MTSDTQVVVTLDERIEKATDGLTGIVTGLSSARAWHGDTKMSTFLDLVPEKGEALWKRFKLFQQDMPGFGFTRFVEATLDEHSTAPAA